MIRTLISAIALSAATLLAATSAMAAPTTYSGVTFPDGDISFADAIVNWAPGSDVGAPHNDPTRALGAPNGGHLSLGDGGTVTLQFTDNSLTTSGDATADLHIFEVGAAVETFFVEISTNGTNWISIGTLSGQPTSIDIDAVAGVTLGAQYSFVRLTDFLNTNQTGFPYGEADIDAVGAISSAAAVNLPVPGALLLLGIGLIGLGLRRKS